MFADVAFPQRRYQVFTYRVPAHLNGHIQVGSRVLVPLGKSLTQGLVYKLSRDFHVQSVREGFSQNNLREISALVDAPNDSTLDPILIKLASQVGDYYLAPPGAALRLILPPSTSNRIAKRIVLTDSGKHALGQSRLSAEQSTVLQRLAKTSKGLTAATILKTIDGNKAILAGLRRRKFVQEVEWVRVVSEKEAISQSTSSDFISSLPRHGSKYDNRGREERSPFKKVKLPAQLSTWLSHVSDSLSLQRFVESLLHASHAVREECLVRCIPETLKRQRKVLVLCPEVQHVSRMVTVLRERWGEHVGEYHGDLSAHIRTQSWYDIQSGRYDVVVGTRSAVFIPLPSVGMIWVEQEEGAAFQEEQNPYYHAREVARMRAKLEAAILILGSSHPSLESVHRQGLLEEASGLQDQNPSSVPAVDVVNVREVPFGTILSDRMVEGVQRALEAKGQVVLFVNRKGYSRALTCRDCGYVPQCPTCGVTLVVYQKPVRMRCSYCGSVHVPPEFCPLCQSIRLEASGYGTEQVEALVREKFPHATVVRFDRETVKTADQETAMLEDIQKGRIDIVIGTEMLFGSQLLPRMHFVGIPNADAGLHFPDFRAAERTYHRLMQAVHLVDADAAESEIVLQTFLPTHHVIRAVAQRDPTVFYQEERQIRQALNYPPYSRLIHIAISGKSSDQVQKMAMYCRERLLAVEQEEIEYPSDSKQPAQGSSNDIILGPLLSSRAKSPGLTRYILIVKESEHENGQSRVKRMQADLAAVLNRERLVMEIKVDPADLN